MKNFPVLLRINHIIQSLLLSIPFLFFLMSCSMTKELDIDVLSIPPALSVTAILNGQSGVFDIRLMDIYSLAELKLNDRRTIIRNGEIRLYEDGILILSIPGPFDMSKDISESGYGYQWGKNGYTKILNGISTHPGSIYRLEVEVEGFPTMVSVSEMPAAPVVTAYIDTSALVIKKNVKEIGAAGYWMNSLGVYWYDKYPEKYWPFSVQIEAPGGVNNYYALDIINVRSDGMQMCGIAGSDAMIYTEIGMDDELSSGKLADIYLFSLLVTNNITNGVARNFYTVAVEVPDNEEYDDSYLEEHPEMEKIITTHNLILRARQITPASYRYFQTLSLQREGGMFNEQPVNVISNIENGYGCFSVYNAAYLTLLWRETVSYHRP